MKLTFLAAGLLLTTALWAQNDDLIVPGTRVGPVTRTSTEASLRQALGKDAVKGKISVGEGDSEPGLILYPNDPTRRLAILWNEQKPAHPSAIIICYAGDGDLPKTCKWHTASGIALGTTLKDLEKRNGKPFKLSGFGWDLGGNVMGWEGGALEKELRPGNTALQVSILPRTDAEGGYLPKVTDKESASVQGDRTLSSSHPVLQKLNPVIAGLTLGFGN